MKPTHTVTIDFTAASETEARLITFAIAQQVKKIAPAASVHGPESVERETFLGTHMQDNKGSQKL